MGCTKSRSVLNLKISGEVKGPPNISKIIILSHRQLVTLHYPELGASTITIWELDAEDFKIKHTWRSTASHAYTELLTDISVINLEDQAFLVSASSNSRSSEGHTINGSCLKAWEELSITEGPFLSDTITRIEGKNCFLCGSTRSLQLITWKCTIQNSRFEFLEQRRIQLQNVNIEKIGSYFDTVVENNRKCFGKGNMKEKVYFGVTAEENERTSILTLGAGYFKYNQMTLPASAKATHFALGFIYAVYPENDLIYKINTSSQSVVKETDLSLYGSRRDLNVLHVNGLEWRGEELVVVADARGEILVFSSELEYLQRIDVKCCPHAMVCYGQVIFLGTDQGLLLTIKL